MADVLLGRLRKTLQEHSKGVTALAYSPHERADKAKVRGAVLKALVSDFHGMTRGKISGYVGIELGMAIDGKKDLAYLLSVMRDDGLIRAEKLTWFIAEKGKEIADAAKVGSFLSLSLFCVHHSLLRSQRSGERKRISLRRGNS
jgi:hypothetical protein